MRSFWPLWLLASIDLRFFYSNTKYICWHWKLKLCKENTKAGIFLQVSQQKAVRRYQSNSSSESTEITQKTRIPWIILNRKIQINFIFLFYFFLLNKFSVTVFNLFHDLCICCLLYLLRCSTVWFRDGILLELLPFAKRAKFKLNFYHYHWRR